MAFVLKKNGESFFYPIHLPVVSGSGASVIQRFEFRFKRLSRTRIEEMQAAQNSSAEAGIETSSLERDADYMLEIADGWKGVVDESGAELPYTRDNILALLDAYPSGASEIVKAFYEATFSGGAKRKN